MVERIVYEHLKASIGSSFEGGVYFHSARSDSGLPRRVIWQVDDPSDKHLLSRYGGQARIQCDIWARQPFELPGLRGVVRDALRQIRTTEYGAQIYNTIIANELTRELDDTELYSAIVDVIVHWTQEA